MHVGAQNNHCLLCKPIFITYIFIFNALATSKSFNNHNFLNLTPLGPFIAISPENLQNMENFKPKNYCRALNWLICLFSMSY